MAVKALLKESARARQAYADYVAMGNGRSLPKLAALHGYGESQVRQWSTTFGWQARLMAVAEREVKEAEGAEAAYRREIMEEGYGLSHERVRALKTLAGKLFEELTTEDPDKNKLWVTDVKQIGSGEFAERVDIERFNSGEVEQLRGLFDDIAKEKGERVTKAELTGAGGAPLNPVPEPSVIGADDVLSIMKDLMAEGRSIDELDTKTILLIAVKRRYGAERLGLPAEVQMSAGSAPLEISGPSKPKRRVKSKKAGASRGKGKKTK